jgi:zinc protease
MQRSRLLFGLPAVCAVLSSLLTITPAVAQEVDLSYQRFVLPNGLTVLVHEDHKAPVVAVNVTYHVGSMNERLGKTGFAHLFEHLMFGGSENVKEIFIDAIERAGATDLNGTTNDDRTNFFETVPVSALEYALFAESDRMGHLNVTQHTLDLQRGVVQNEKRQGENRPYAVGEDLRIRSTYPAEHPYSHSTIGSMEDLNAASLADVKEWFRTYYGPSNATLILAGDITVDNAHRLVEKYFGAIPPGPPVTHQDQWVAKMTGTHVEEAQDHVPQPRVDYVWNVPGYGSADADYLELIGNILSKGKVSRLYQKLVYESQLATNVHASIEPNAIAGQFSIDVMVKAGGDPAAVKKILEDELKSFLANGPTADELERAKTGVVGEWLRETDAVIVQTFALADGAVLTGNPDEYKIMLDRQRRATARDLQDAAVRWLSDGVYEQTILPYPTYQAQGADVDRSHAPAIGASPEIKLPAFQKATLSNGLKVVLAERHELPVVEFSMLVNGGFSADHFALPGTAQMASSLLTGGTDKYSALEISGLAQKLGAELTATSNVDTSEVNLSAIKARLDPSLDLFADVVLHPSFSAEDFQRQQKLQSAKIKREQASPSAEALRVVPPLLFGKNHPYSMPLTGSGTEEGIAKLTREDLVRFHETWFKPNNATLIVVGDTTLAELRPKLEGAFASWKSGSVPTNAIPTVDSPAQPEVYLIDKPDAVQSTICVATVAPPKHSKEDIALAAWNEVMGAFSGRINMNLREDKHWSYGAFSNLVDTQAQRPFIVFTSVQTDKTKESLVEINRELHDIVSTRPPTQQELNDVIAHQTRSQAGKFETTSSVSSAIGEIVTFNLPENYFITFGPKMSALRTSDVAEAGDSFLNPDRMIWVIVGDRSKIESEIRGLNLGTFHLVDVGDTKQ